MNVGFNDGRGNLTWTLPEELAEQLADLDPERRARILKSLESNVGILCLALLKSFGHDNLISPLNAIMAEIHRITK